MPIDQHTFFHEGTLRICGSLDIAESLERCHDFLARYMPVQGIGVNIFEPNLKGVRLIAGCGPIMKSVKVDEFIGLNPQSVAHIQARLRRSENWGRALVARRLEENPAAMEMQKLLGLRLGSYMDLHLAVKEEKVGVISILCERENAFSREHADLLTLLHDPFAIALSNSLRYREVLRLQEMQNDDNRFLRRELHHIAGDEIVGQNFGLSQVMDMVRQVSALDSNVLLLGETGVGKEVIANAIHYSSPRAAGPLVKVNCGALPETIMDSELFGHEKGAFTGAVARRRGRFERAHNGTIFLDEIAELPQAAQVRLLRVIQTRQIERVGGGESVSVNARVIAATHRDLERMVKDGRFREDLWFRLNVFPITIPPLRRRKADIPALVTHFIERKARDMNLPYIPVPAPGSLQRLQAHDWPGNVRELENAVERELIRSHAQSPDLPLLFSDFTARANLPQEPAVKTGTGEAGQLRLDEVVSRHIVRVMGQTGGKIQGPDGAAALLGLHPSTLRNRMRKLGIPFGRAKG